MVNSISTNSIKAKIKRFLIYLIYVIIIGYLIFRGALYQINLHHVCSEENNAALYYMFTGVFNILIGVLLALPQFASNFKISGQWKFDWPKFMAIGIPAFFGAIAPTIYFTSLSQLLPHILIYTFMHFSILSTTSGIVFGYLLINSFNKQNIQY